MNHLRDVLSDPLSAALVLLALSYALSRRAPRVAFVLPGVALAVLLVFSVPRVSNGLLRALEQPAMTTMKPGVTYDAVVVLGGGLNANISAQTGQPAFNDAVDRLLSAFDLLRTNRARNAILSGGNPEAAPGVQAESRFMAAELEAWGIDSSRLVLDERSTNTHENAVESVRLARAQGWTRVVLVTSAAHMPRARGCFAHEGLAVDSLAVDFRSEDPAKSDISWLPRSRALADSTFAIHERIGRLVYRARGWID